MPLESKYWKLEKDLQLTIKFDVNILIVIAADALFICTNNVAPTIHNGINNLLVEHQPYLQFMAASSFTYSAVYTKATVEKHNGSLWEVSSHAL